MLETVIAIALVFFMVCASVCFLALAYLIFRMAKGDL